MRVLISGASGFIGSAVRDRLIAGGHDVAKLVRRQARSDDEVSWDPAKGALEPAAVSGFDAVIHLAGENIAGGRWSAERKKRIVRSRVDGTRTLVDALVQAESKPKVLLSASAVGFFGARGDEKLDEGSAMGEGFLAETCRDWEAQTKDAMYAGIRVAHPRFGLVLGQDGGALPKMLLPFRLGVGGRLGHGRQYMSWVSIDDVTRAIEHLLVRDDLAGPVHVVGPAPVTNAEFTKTLARCLHRPAVLPVPAFALRTLLGREMADALLLTGQRVYPRRLQETGFDFDHPDLESALRAILSR